MLKDFHLIKNSLLRIVSLATLLYFTSVVPLLADLEEPYPGSPHQIEAAIGYRGVSATDHPGRAQEYDSLISSPTFDLIYRGSCSYSENFVDIHYLNEKDYYLETDFNIRSRLRFNFLNERLFHTLDHFPYDPATTLEARPAGISEETVFVDYLDHDPGRNYHLQVDQTEVSLRYKLPDYPAHANIKYWRWEKTGMRQLRFVDESCTSCHMQSKTLPINQVTEEVTAGIDAHLGLIDLMFEQIVRTFRNKSAAPVDTFEGADPLLASGDYQHNATPDLHFTQSALKAHTTLGGGFVASASAAIGQRENDASLRDVSFPSIETDFRKLTADTTYTPSTRWTLNLRYRMLDLDQDTPGQVVASGTLNTPFAVRDGLDLERSYYKASLSYRPAARLTLKGNYHREDIHRGNTNGPVLHDSFANRIDPYWELPENETIQKARLTVSARFLPKNALKLQGWYEYQTSDEPAYNISIESGQTLYMSAIYRHNPRWGGTLSTRFRELRNNDDNATYFDESEALWSVHRDREQSQHKASIGLWFIPIDGITFDLNYGYLGNHIKQDLLYGQTAPSYAIKDRADYRQSVYTLAAGVNWQVTDAVNCRLEGYHIQSRAKFTPDFPAETLPIGAALEEVVSMATDNSLQDISEIDLCQKGLKGRIAWQVNDKWRANIELTMDDYDDRQGSLFDGTVETCSFSVARSW